MRARFEHTGIIPQQAAEIGLVGPTLAPADWCATCATTTRRVAPVQPDARRRVAGAMSSPAPAALARTPALGAFLCDSSPRRRRRRAGPPPVSEPGQLAVALVEGWRGGSATSP
ncbi:MAG: hypothetical protein U1G05_13145 [Kiritimatiellia bacterium]